MKLITTFIFAFITFTFTGWLGWIGLIISVLKIFGIIHWSWWVALLPIEYGVIYCLYMTIDGAKYRLGLKDAGRFARYTQNISSKESEELQIQTIIKEGPEIIGETIERLTNIPSRLKFNQSLLDASLEHYYPLQLAMFGNKSINAHVTLQKWRASGLNISETGD